MSLNHLQAAILSGDIDTARRAASAEPSLLDSRSEVGTPIVALARQTGNARIVLAMLRAASQPPGPGAARELLNDVMSETSQAIACAGWLHDVEFLLWQLLDSGTLSEDLDLWGFRAMTPADLADLAWLAQLAGGWWHWDEASSGSIFVETGTWRALHAAWIRTKT